MFNTYKYLDSTFKYIDPTTGLLRNLPNITDAEALMFFESAVVTKRLQELYEHPIKIKGIESLFKIHFFLFQDVYAWAGKKREVEISKDGRQFFPISHFDFALQYIDNLIVEYFNTSIENTILLTKKLAEILDHINYLHPFREGNGRVQREFIRLLALERGFIINLNPPDNQAIYDRYMKGTIEGDINILTNLILELIEMN